MGYIEICESGSAVDCYVQKAGSDLSAFMSAGSDVFTLLLARWRLRPPCFLRVGYLRK